MEPWNDSSILPPPVHTYKCDSDIDTQQLTYTCNIIIKVLKKQSPLHKEAAICSRFVYKFDKKFRNDIGYRYFKKVNTALRKYLLLNLLKDVENFLSVLPNMEDDKYLPTQQMLEYILVRLITFSKLMLRTYLCAKQAAIFYLDRIKRGESHWMSLMPYALMSRIWSISAVLLQHSTRWYNYFYPFLVQLKPKGLAFLPSNYKLPEDLTQWLDLTNLDNFGRFNWSQKKHAEIDPILVEDDEGDILENILEYVQQINEENPEEMEAPTTNVKEITKTIIELPKVTEDQGEKISRDIFKIFFKPPEADMKHTADRVTNKTSLNQFITTEERYRNEDNNWSLTSHLSFMQWQALKNSLIALHDSLSNNRKIEKKFQKLWKEKCLDYK